MKYWTHRHWDNWREAIGYIETALGAFGSEGPVEADVDTAVRIPDIADLDCVESASNLPPSAVNGEISPIENKASEEQLQTTTIDSSEVHGLAIPESKPDALQSHLDEQSEASSAETDGETVTIQSDHDADEHPEEDLNDRDVESPVESDEDISDPIQALPIEAELTQSPEGVTEILGDLFHDADSLDDSNTERPLGESIEPSQIQPQAAQALPLDKLARHFFSNIPWGQADVGIIHEKGNHESEILDECSSIAALGMPKFARGEAFDLSVSAKDFFSAMPWLEGSIGDSGDADEEIMSISIGTHANDEGHEIRSTNIPSGNPLVTGLLSAAKTSDRSAAAKSLNMATPSNHFFNAIPW